MPVTVANKKTAFLTIEARYENPIIIDVTSKSKDKFLALSPFTHMATYPCRFRKDFTPGRLKGFGKG
jgi:hypothetical protein